MTDSNVRPMNIAAPGEPEDVRWVYLKEGKPLPFALIATQIARRINGLLLIRKDLWLAQRALDTLVAQVKTDDTIILRWALWCAATVSYAKCFTDAEGRGIKLSAKDVFKGKSAPLYSVHDWMMKLRHSYIAHAGNTDEEQIKTFVALAADPEKRALVANYHNMELSLTIPDQAAEEYLKAIQFVLQHVESLLDKAYPALMKDVESQSLEHWYAEATWPR